MEAMSEYEETAAVHTDANTTKGHSNTQNTPHSASESLKASHTFDTITLLDRAQHLELLQHIDSVVQHIEDNWNEDGKANSPSGPSRGTTVGTMPMAANNQYQVRHHILC